MNYVDHLTDQSQVEHTLIDVGGRASIAPIESTSTSSKAYAVGKLLYFEGVLYKVTSAIAQGDSIVTSGSGQNVEVDTVSGELGEIQNQIDVVRDNGAVNILKYPYYHTTQTKSGIPYIDNGDGTITANAGTATGNSEFTLAYPFSLKAGTYIFSGRPDNSGARLQIVKNGNIYSVNVGTGSFGTFTLDSDLEGAEVRLRIMNGTTIDSPIVFSPMIYDARFGSNVPFQPHTETNTILTQKVAGLQVTGCVNVMPNNATSQVVRGLTITKNGDKTLTLSGIPNANVIIRLIGSTTTDTFKVPKSGKYKLVGIPAGGSTSTYKFDLSYFSGGTEQLAIRDIGNGGIATLYTANNYLATLVIYSGTDLSTPITIKPMLTPNLSATYDDYQPYSMTNRELTEAVTGNTFGTFVDATSLLPYTIPSDGYITAGAKGSSSYIYARIKDANNVDGPECYVIGAGTDTWMQSSVFVRKGMIVYSTGMIGTARVRFYPINN